MQITATYAHPQGSLIHVYADGSLVKTGPDGKVKKTSATAAKLAAGHGGWTLVTDGDVAALAAAIAAPTPTPAPGPGAVSVGARVPMKFAEAPVTQLAAYVTDPAWILQQKVDGIRAQLVFTAETAPWFRNGTGTVLANAVGTAVSKQIVAKLGTLPAGAVGYAVDGEIVGGKFWAFDLITDGKPLPLADRLVALKAWHAAVVRFGLGDLLRLLPTAFTQTAKAELAVRVAEEGGEGWIAKRLDGGYAWGARVDHSLKLKVTTTVDVVVTAVGVGGKQSAALAAHDATGALVEIGRASTIGKGPIAEGQVLEVRYLYVGADGRLVQPRILRVRTDKPAAACTTAQLRMVNKEVLV